MRPAQATGLDRCGTSDLTPTTVSTPSTGAGAGAVSTLTRVRGNDRRHSWASEQRDFATWELIKQGVDVHCLRCSGKALVRRDGTESRITCGACGFSRVSGFGLIWPDGSQPIVRDACFGAALWLQTACAGHVLWAVNEDHLTHIEGFVAARQRRDRSSRLFNSALGEQFPKWMVLAKNRAAVLASIEELRQRSA